MESFEKFRNIGEEAFSFKDLNFTAECWQMLRLQPPSLSADQQIACPTHSHGAIHSLQILPAIKHIFNISNAALEVLIGSLCTAVRRANLLILSLFPTQLSPATGTTLARLSVPSWVFKLQVILRVLGIQLQVRQIGFSRHLETLLRLPQQQDQAMLSLSPCLSCHPLGLVPVLLQGQEIVQSIISLK